MQSTVLLEYDYIYYKETIFDIVGVRMKETNKRRDPTEPADGDKLNIHTISLISYNLANIKF